MSNNLASKKSFSDWFVQRAKYQGIFSKIQDFKKILGPPAPLSYHSHMTIYVIGRILNFLPRESLIFYTHKNQSSAITTSQEKTSMDTTLFV